MTPLPETRAALWSSSSEHGGGGGQLFLYFPLAVYSPSPHRTASGLQNHAPVWIAQGGRDSDWGANPVGTNLRARHLAILQSLVIREEGLP